MSASFDDQFAASELPQLYAEYGVDATVQRGADAPVPVRVIVDYAVRTMGELGQMVGEQDQASFMVAQWRPAKGDVLVWANRFGPATKRVTSLITDDGLEAVVVIRG